MTNEDSREDFPGVTFQDYVNTRFDEISRAAALALDSAKGEAVPLRQFIEAILDEQRRGMIVAEQEREKAAKALRDELARAIEEGDNNLRDHIRMQVQQIREALDSQEKLDLQRHANNQQSVEALDRRITETLERGMQRLEGLRREMELIQGSAAEAIAKAEAASERRFESVNEFRQTLTDQTAQFIRREVFEARIKDLEARIGAIADQLNLSRGSRAGVNAMTGVMLAVATLVLGIVIFLANLLTGG